jgi:hypothetical protein
MRIKFKPLFRTQLVSEGTSATKDERLEARDSFLSFRYNSVALMKLWRAFAASFAFLLTAFFVVARFTPYVKGGRGQPVRVRVSVRPATIAADGWSQATLSIDRPAGVDRNIVPRIEIASGSGGVALLEIENARSRWTVPVRAGVVPGEVMLRATVSGFVAGVVKLQLAASNSDSIGDGTPDFLRLDDERDRAAFRRWFTFLVEEQYFHPTASRPAEIDDCAALVRYAYREALHPHDGAWPRASDLLLVPAMDSVRKYSYPNTPLGADLFRLRAGPFHASDVRAAAFGQFADTETLQRFNTHQVGRELSRALPGDLLFFRRDIEHMPFHTMVVMGRSQISDSPESYVVYHTGPDGNKPGEIRRLTVAELLSYPDPQWRPVSANPNFLGVYRWNILHEAS